MRTLLSLTLTALALPSLQGAPQLPATAVPGALVLADQEERNLRHLVVTRPGEVDSFLVVRTAERLTLTLEMREALST